VNKYFLKYGFQTIKLLEKPSDNLGIIVVIPCFNEKNILATLSSLNSCNQSFCDVKIIIVINQSEIISEEISSQNEQTFKEIKQGKKENNYSFKLDVLFEKELPKKHAGVGLARKIGMDEAVMQFDSINKDGIIVCLDADCEVESNYFVEIEKHFETFPKTPGCSIKYAHHLEGNVYKQDIYEGIINYELHLRYYNQMLHYCGVPYAFHTVGSSMAIKSSAYQKQGGMNKRKAGEDFYFLHKIIELGGFTELNSTTVFPSPRISDRVPFGTGKAIGDWIDSKENEYFTYDFCSFDSLKIVFDNLKTIYRTSKFKIKNDLVISFLKQIDFEKKIEEIKNNTTNFESFKKRFYTFFNAFMILKFVHFSRDNFYKNQSIESQTKILLKKVHNLECNALNKKELLELLRKIEKNELGEKYYFCI